MTFTPHTLDPDFDLEIVGFDTPKPLVTTPTDAGP